MEKYVQVGKTRKTHGVKGGVKLQIQDKFLDDVLRLEVAFLKIQGKLIPYFIEHFDFTNNLIVKFEEIDSPEAAIPITSKEFYIRESDIQMIQEADVENQLEFGKFQGFTILDKTLGLIGKINDIVEYPQQEMAEVEYRGKEVLIPLHQNLVVSINHEDLQLVLDLPEGLLEI